MPYVQRNVYGEIESLHRAAQPGADEHLPSEDPEVLAFVGAERAASGFGQLDADFVRVIEDVIDTLIIKNLLNITDLPGEAQAKLFARKSFRERLAKNSLSLFGETDPGFVEVVKDTGFADL